jgi:hypothetical protein
MISKVKAQHIYTLASKDTSWELKEQIAKHLKCSVEFTTDRMGCITDKGYVITSDSEIPMCDLEHMDKVLLPKWIKEIKEANDAKEAEDFKRQTDFLRNVALPIETNVKRLVKFRDSIMSLYDEIKNDQTMGKVYPCGVGDCTELINLYNIVATGDRKAASKAIWSMDTGARDYIPRIVRDWIGDDEA